MDISERHNQQVSKNICDTSAERELLQAPRNGNGGGGGGGSDVKTTTDSNSSDPVSTAITNRNLEWEKSLVNLETIKDQPEFPLLPASRGFCLTLRKTLAAFRNIVDTQRS